MAGILGLTTARAVVAGARAPRLDHVYNRAINRRIWMNVGGVPAHKDVQQHREGRMTGMLEPGVVLVRGSATGFAQEIMVGRHKLLMDEPTSAGGTDTGPGPYDLILAALGA